jgi:hypothetical protein
MLVHLIFGAVPEWPVPEHEKIHDAYFRRRDKKNGLKISRTLEVGLSLVLAERHRAAGYAERARELVAFAVENHPGHTPLRALERAFDPEKPIDWREVVLPGRDASESAGATGQS